MYKCIINKCDTQFSVKHKNKETNGVVLHTFPKSIERKKEWCNAILILTGQIIPLKTNRTYLICTKHFSPEDTVFDEYGTTVLTKDAVPKYFPDSDKQSQGVTDIEMLIDEFLDTDALADTTDNGDGLQSKNSQTNEDTTSHNEPAINTSKLASLKLMIVENRKLIQDLENTKQKSLATFEIVKNEMKVLKTRYEQYITRNEIDEDLLKM